MTEQLPTGGAIIGGVEIDATGRVVAYHVYESYIPGVPLLKGLTLTRVPASELLHAFTVSAAGQCRGVSAMTPSLLRANEFDQLNDAMLTKAKSPRC